MNLLVLFAVSLIGLISAILIIQSVSIYRTMRSLPPTPAFMPDVSRSFPPRWRMPVYQGVMWIQQSVSYYLQTLTAVWHAGRIHRRPRTVTQADVVNYVLNSGCVIYCSPQRNAEGAIVRDASGATRHLFLLKDFVFFDYPASVRTRTSTLSAVFATDGTTAVVHEFLLDDRPLLDPGEQLALLMVIESIAIHTTIHSFHEVLFYSQGKLPPQLARRIFLHGAFLNAAAPWLPSTILGVAEPVVRQALHANAVAKIPVHNLGTLREYLPISRFVRFLLRARQEFYSLCEQHDLQIDTQAFFLCSLLHSLDHFAMEQGLAGRSLTLSLLPACQRAPYRLSLYHLMFIRESQYVGSNKLKDHTHRHAFFAELYDRLRLLDAEYADHVTLSISY